MAFNFTTDENGAWSGPVCVRVNPDSTSYGSFVNESDGIYLSLHARKTGKSTYDLKDFVRIGLLDMDSSTANGTEGGWFLGFADGDYANTGGLVAVMEDNLGRTVGCYVSEDNGINETGKKKTDEATAALAGFLNISAPTGDNYTLRLFDADRKEVWNRSGISVRPGSYGFNANCNWGTKENLVKPGNSSQFSVQVGNTGTLDDTISVAVEGDAAGWSLSPKEAYLDIPRGSNSTFTFTVSVSAVSSPSLSAKIRLSSTGDPTKLQVVECPFGLDLPDLYVSALAVGGSASGAGASFLEGETLEVTATISNKGSRSTPTQASIAVCGITRGDAAITSRSVDIEPVNIYRKPSLTIDTSGWASGDYVLRFTADAGGAVKELDESNNARSFSFSIADSSPLPDGRALLSAVYPYAQPRMNNEFIEILNPFSSQINVSGWVVTSTPERPLKDAKGFALPQGTFLQPGKSIIVTQNLSAYASQTGRHADLCWKELDGKSFSLPNNGGLVALKDNLNHTIDAFLYGGVNPPSAGCGWNGEPFTEAQQGVIFERALADKGDAGATVMLFDTDTAADWKASKKMGVVRIPPPLAMSVSGSVIPFMSPDNGFDAVSSFIDSAGESLYINVYKFTSIPLAMLVAGAAERGVDVRLFLEGSPVGGVDGEEIGIADMLSAAGCRVSFMVNQPGEGRFSPYPFNHAKYMVADNASVLVMSANMGGSNLPEDRTIGNREWGAIIKNREAASYFAGLFLADTNPELAHTAFLGESAATSFASVRGKTGSKEAPQSRDSAGVPDYSTGALAEFFGVFNITPVISPDNSLDAIVSLIDSCERTICIEQLYIYRNWSDGENPFVSALVRAAERGVKVRVLLNYNPSFSRPGRDSNDLNAETMEYLRSRNISTLLLYTNATHFVNLHNKGGVFDGRSVLISSVNWNENSVAANREAGVIIENGELAGYFAAVFECDWELSSNCAVAGHGWLYSAAYAPLAAAISANGSGLTATAIITSSIIVVLIDWRRRFG